MRKTGKGEQITKRHGTGIKQKVTLDIHPIISEVRVSVSVLDIPIKGRDCQTVYRTRSNFTLSIGGTL